MKPNTSSQNGFTSDRDIATGEAGAYPVGPSGCVRLSLTHRQAYRLRLLLLGEIDNPGTEQTHRKTWTEIVAKLDRLQLELIQ